MGRGPKAKEAATVRRHGGGVHGVAGAGGVLRPRPGAETLDRRAHIAFRKALRLPSPGASRRALLEVMRLERLAQTGGSVVAAYNLAHSYLTIGKPREAVRRFRLLALAGDQSALLEVARAELLGIGTRRDVPGAVRKLKRVARPDSDVAPFERELAMLTLSNALHQGWILPRNSRSTVQWLRRAAKVGSAAAKGMLADLGEQVGPLVPGETSRADRLSR